jgi:molecular chaperone HscB
MGGVTTDRDETKCGGCGAPGRAGEACRECGRLHPFPAGVDHFRVLGLDRRLQLDPGDLQRRVHQLNRRFHPDYFRLRSAEEQATSLDNTAAVNAAYRVLRDPAGRVEYLFELEDVAPGAARPPADLFAEIMEIQEARQDLATAGAGEAPALRARLEEARVELRARRTRAEAELASLFPRWDAAGHDERRTLLVAMRDILATRAYLRTVLRDLAATLRDGDADEGSGTH